MQHNRRQSWLGVGYKIATNKSYVLLGKSAFAPTSVYYLLFTLLLIVWLCIYNQYIYAHTIVINIT